MAEEGLSVKISADVTSLQAKAAVAKAEYAALSASVRSLAKDYTTASEETKTALNAQLQAAVAAAEGQKTVLAGLTGQIAEAAGEAAVAKSAFGEFHASLLEMGEQAEAVTGKISEFTGAFSAIGELAAVGFGVDLIGEQIAKTAELGESYAQLAEKTGATIPQLAALRLAAMQTGTDFDVVGNGVRELGMKMQDALIHPAGESAEAFKKLGVSITDSNGQLLPVIDVFQQISQELASFQDGTAKTALASDVLGAKFGSTLIPVINEVGDGFDTLQAKASAYGLAMSQDEVDASERFAQSQKDMQASLIGVRTEIVGPLLGAFADIESALANNLLESDEVKTGVKALSIAFAGVVDVGVAVGTAIADVTSVAFTLGETMGVVATEVLAAGEAMTGHLALALQTAKEGVDELKTSFTELGNSIMSNEKLFGTVTSDLISGAMGGPGLAPATTMTTLAEHQGGGDQAAPQLSPDIPKSGGGAGAARSDQNQITQIAQDAAEARKAIAASEYDAQVSNWEAEVAQGKMTKAQEVQDEVAAQNQMYQAALAEAQQEAALLPAGTAAKAKALDDIEVLAADHVAKMAALNEQLVEAQTQAANEALEKQQEAAAAASAAWQKAFQPISQAFDSSLNGIIQGTQTLQNAEAKAAQSITLAFIDAEAKKLTSFLASEAQILAHSIATETGMTAAVVAGNTARLSAKASADAAGRAQDVALGTAQINSDAMKAAAGAYAAMAGVPIVGPVLAPAAAVTAYAGVMAFDVLSAAGGLALGSGENPIVQLHEKEMVLPADISQPLTAMIAGGTLNDSSAGDTHVTNNFNLTANGGGGGVSANDILSALNTAIRSGALQNYPAIARLMRR